MRSSSGVFCDPDDGCGSGGGGGGGGGGGVDEDRGGLFGFDWLLGDDTALDKSELCSANDRNLSISCGFGPDTGRLRFFNSAFKSLTKGKRKRNLKVKTRARKYRTKRDKFCFLNIMRYTIFYRKKKV